MESYSTDDFYLIKNRSSKLNQIIDNKCHELVYQYSEVRNICIYSVKGFIRYSFIEQPFQNAPEKSRIAPYLSGTQNLLVSLCNTLSSKETKYIQFFGKNIFIYLFQINENLFLETDVLNTDREGYFLIAVKKLVQDLNQLSGLDAIW